jgi:hypothetical protein
VTNVCTYITYTYMHVSDTQVGLDLRYNFGYTNRYAPICQLPLLFKMSKSRPLA